MVRRLESTTRYRRPRQRISPQTLLVCGAILLAAFIVSRRQEDPRDLSRSNDSAQERRYSVRSQLVDIPVAIRRVEQGEKLSAVAVKRVAFYRNELPADVIEEIEPYGEALIKSDLLPNEPIRKADLALTAPAAFNPVVDKIPTGMRAMTIRVDETSAVEGWARTGSIVDVLLVESEKTVVIAEKVKILSAERSVSLAEEGNQAKVPSTVTILVSQEQCLAINTALPLGRIAFALRSLGDESRWSDTVYTAERLKRGGNREPESQTVVSGYVSIKEGDTKSAYALADGKWIKTEAVPQGFFPAHEQQGVVEATDTKGEE